MVQTTAGEKIPGGIVQVCETKTWLALKKKENQKRQKREVPEGSPPLPQLGLEARAGVLFRAPAPSGKPRFSAHPGSLVAQLLSPL